MRPYLLLFVVSFFFHLNLTSQEKFGEYVLSIENGKLIKGPFNLEISREKQLLYVYMHPIGDGIKGGEGGIELSIKKKQHQAFISALINAKQKFVEWDSVAKKNNVNEEVRKEMNFRLNGIEAFFKYGSDWRFDKWIDLVFYFLYTKEQKPFLAVRTTTLTADDNEYMKHDGFAFYFDDISKIDEFVDMISDSKIQEFLSSPPATDLFKD